jgi:hypothetical protein
MPFDLALPVGWVLSGGFWLVLAKCLLICPIMPMLLGLVFESRWVPLSPRFQFTAFFPGNPLLAIYIAWASTFKERQSPSGFWQTSSTQHLLVVGTFLAYIQLSNLDLASKFTREQLAGPTKRYHNALYFWYGYVIAVATILVVTASVPVSQRLLASIPGLLWVGCLIYDSVTPEESLNIKFQTAHAPWNPLWKTMHLLTLQYNRSLHSYVYS